MCEMNSKLKLNKIKNQAVPIDISTLLKKVFIIPI
jgi:hypothetical protein